MIHTMSQDGKDAHSRLRLPVPEVIRRDGGGTDGISDGCGEIHPLVRNQGTKTPENQR